YCFCFCSFFFFQAEDGIRDFHVTGVQTCALPIFFTTTYLTSSKVMSTQLSSLPHNLQIQLESTTSGVDPFYLSLAQDTGILLAILPLIIIYLFVQRYFVESVERTGIVG